MVEESANRHARQQAEDDKAAHEDAMVAHMATKAKEQALAAGATKTEVNAAAAREATSALVANGVATPMTD